jgi:hypothetical protein
MALTIKDNVTLEVTTSRLTAVFQGATLVSLISSGGRPMLQSSGGAGLGITFSQGDPAPLGTGPFAQVQVVKLGERVAHVYIEDDEGDACLKISIDAQDRLVLEPSAQTLRQGLGAVRLNLSGVAAGLKLVAPFFQGCRQEVDHPLVVGYWSWPQMWEAALAILQGEGEGFSVHCEDRRCLPKGLAVIGESRTLGLDTQALGPWHDNATVGGIAWIIDCHQGDWQGPARQYRDWLAEAYSLDRLAALRPPWMGDIRLGVQWCPMAQAVLDALEAVLPPARVMLHVPSWRSDPYDVNYPEYNASPAGKAFIQQAVGRGFRVLPHFNYCAIDPNHPIFPRVTNYVLRDMHNQRLLGWRWKSGTCLPFPQGHGNITRHRGQNVMAYVHGGLSVWRRELARRIAAATDDLGTDGAFVDQTLCTCNCDNALVENITSVEGMVALMRDLCEVGGGLVLGGEGRNEMNMQYQAFAQAHLYMSWFTNHAKFAELDPVPVGDVLYGGLCRTMGYNALDGATPESQLRLDVHEKLGAIPSLTIRGAADIVTPNSAVQQMLARARA